MTNEVTVPRQATAEAVAVRKSERVCKRCGNPERRREFCVVAPAGCRRRLSTGKGCQRQLGLGAVCRPARL